LPQQPIHIPARDRPALEKRLSEILNLTAVVHQLASCGIAMKLPQPHNSHRNEGKIGDDVPKVRHAEESTLVGKAVIALILGDRR
jgi:hypothetical protein